VEFIAASVATETSIAAPLIATTASSAKEWSFAVFADVERCAGGDHTGRNQCQRIKYVVRAEGENWVIVLVGDQKYSKLSYMLRYRMRPFVFFARTNPSALEHKSEFFCKPTPRTWEAICPVDAANLVRDLQNEDVKRFGFTLKPRDQRPDDAA
jgi:hypothetical protein